MDWKEKAVKILEKENNINPKVIKIPLPFLSEAQPKKGVAIAQVTAKTVTIHPVIAELTL